MFTPIHLMQITGRKPVGGGGDGLDTTITTIDEAIAAAADGGSLEPEQETSRRSERLRQRSGPSGTEAEDRPAKWSAAERLAKKKGEKEAKAKEKADKAKEKAQDKDDKVKEKEKAKDKDAEGDAPRPKKKVGLKGMRKEQFVDEGWLMTQTFDGRGSKARDKTWHPKPIFSVQFVLSSNYILSFLFCLLQPFQSSGTRENDV